MTPRQSAEVYRRRRIVAAVAAVLAVVLVYVLGSLVVGLASGHSSAPVSTPSDTPTTGASSPVPVAGGTCLPSDLAITPVLKTGVATDPIVLHFEVRSVAASVCLWTPSRSTMQVAISRGGLPFWSTLDCAGSIPAQTITVRQDAPTGLDLIWDGHGSRPCGDRGVWASPGTYQLQVAALGGNPSVGRLTLIAPGAVVKPSPKPSPKATAKASAKATTKAKPKAGASPSAH